MDKIKETVDVFNKYACQYQDKFMSYPPYVATYKAFAELLTDKHCSVLDVACGPGNFSRFLLNERPALSVTGIDLAPEMITLAERNIPQGDFRVMDSRAIATLNKKFDVILLGFCLPYLSREETAQLLADTGKLIKKHGVLYLSTMEGDYSRSGYQANSSEDRIFIYYHSLKFLSDELVRNGFDIVHSERVTFPSESKPEVEDLFIFAESKR